MNEIFKEHLGSEEWYKDLFDNTHDLIHVADTAGTLIYVNSSWVDLLEYSQQDVLGQPVYTFIQESDRNRFAHYIDNLIPYHKEPFRFSFISKSGKKVCVEGSVSIKSQKGKEPYTTGIFKDITQRIEQEEQLKHYTEELSRREQNLHELLDNAPAAIVVFNRENNISFWNRKAELLFGWKADELIGREFFNTIIPANHREAVVESIKNMEKSIKSPVLNKRMEITALNKSGKEFYIALMISITRQQQDISFIAFITDITAQKENQLALERKTKELERSNANLEDFAYAASHDLKEPIRKIHLFSDLLKEKLSKELSGEASMLFNRMQVATERMQLLIDDLLEYSHVNKGIDLWETVDLNKKVQLVLTDLEVPINEKNAKISVGKLPIVRGHRRQLQQVFQNLISNSLKYIQPGVGPEINISCESVKGSEIPCDLSSTEKEDHYYLIKVRDNGIGFEQVDAEKIFQVFQRLHGNAEYKGSGVGLSIVRKVLQNHGGHIFAESEPGNGATFKIYLPVKPVS